MAAAAAAGFAGTAFADSLANIKHGSFINLTFTDYYFAAHFYSVEHIAHGMHRSIISGILVSPSKPVIAGQCGCFGNPAELQGHFTFHNSS